MIYIIKTELKDVIVFDSVTSFSETYGGSVTSHPVEDGVKISDHSIIENPKFRISGVVSDFNFFNPIKDFTVDPYTHPSPPSNSSLLNAIDPVTLSLTDDAISIPTDLTGFDNDGDFSLKTQSQTIKAKLIEIQRNRVLVDILRYPGDNKVERISPCILTDISFVESPDSGYAVYPEMQFEKINTVKVVVRAASSDKIIPEELKLAAAEVAAKGNKAGTTIQDGKPVNAEAHSELMKTLDDKTAQAVCSAQWRSQDAGMPPPPCAYQYGWVKGWSGVLKK